jgi:hypothetical protein
MKEFLFFDPKLGRMISQTVPRDWVDPVADSMRRTFEMFKCRIIAGGDERPSSINGSVVVTYQLKSRVLEREI